MTGQGLRRLSLRQRGKAAAIAALSLPVIKAMSATWHWLERGTEHEADVRRQGRQPIYALWHGRILSGTIYLRQRDIVVMTSENFDGEWVARIIRRFGFEPARGSTSRGGGRALVEMRRRMRAGAPAAFTVDGPRGPARVVQPGAVWLARLTGNPVIPIHLEASSAWVAKSWDHHQIPKPGATIATVLGRPIDVARDADDAALEAARLELEHALAALEDEARHLALAGKPR